MLSILMIKDDYKKDLVLFKKFEKERKPLINNPKFEEIYEVSYIIYNLLPSSKLDPELNNYSNLIKRDLVSAIDLINLQHFESSKRDLRSMIETVFRLIGYIFKGYIYLKRKERKIYGSSCQIYSIRSALDTHRIGKLTKLIEKLFKDNIIYSDIKPLLDYYSSFSNTVHTNNAKENIFHNDLTTLTTHTSNEFENFSKDVLSVLIHTIGIIYFSRLILFSNDSLSQQNFYYINRILSTYTHDNNYLLKLQNNYLDGIFIDFN